MTKSVLALPVTIEQIATAIKQMSPAERQRLFELVPELQPERWLPSSKLMPNLVRF